MKSLNTVSAGLKFVCTLAPCVTWPMFFFLALTIPIKLLCTEDYATFFRECWEKYAEPSMIARGFAREVITEREDYRRLMGGS